MNPSVSEAEFDVLVAQTSLPLSAEQKRSCSMPIGCWKP